jgi:hypothetical protein
MLVGTSLLTVCCDMHILSCTLTISQEACGVAYDGGRAVRLQQMLSEYQAGYVLATTEAGLLPPIRTEGRGCSAQ